MMINVMSPTGSVQGRPNIIVELSYGTSHTRAPEEMVMGCCWGYYNMRDEIIHLIKFLFKLSPCDIVFHCLSSLPFFL